MALFIARKKISLDKSDVQSDAVKGMIDRKINFCKNKVTFDELDNLAKGKTIDETKPKIIKLKDFVVNVVKLTINWLRDKIKSKLYKKMAKKVAVFVLGDMITSCTNQRSLEELTSLSRDGYTHIMTELDDNGKVQNTECIKDTSPKTDPNVRSFINKTGQGMVIVSS
ncbi:MAG: hypothetical protein HDT22_00265 [Ruminococcus sp.]|nr:hypothetical protein [Ruminococcus sp.]